MHHDEDFRASAMWMMMGPHGSLPLHVGGILVYEGSQEEANPRKAQRQQTTSDGQLQAATEDVTG